MVEQLGENVRRLRNERGWSQQELADKVGIIQPAISQIESGNIRPRYTTLLALANALDVSLDTLAANSSNAVELQ